MARFFDPTPDQQSGWNAWVAERPEKVRKVAERFDPWSLCRLKPNGERVSVLGFGETEDGEVTVKVNISGEYNRVLFERQVFGIDPDDLEPCDLPTSDEKTGALMSQDQVEDNIDMINAMIKAHRNDN
jgi:hypothetical protein